MICECMFAKWKRSMLFFFKKKYLYIRWDISIVSNCVVCHTWTCSKMQKIIFVFFFINVDTAHLRPLAWNNEKVCFPRHKEPNRTHHLPFWSSEPLIFLCVSMLSSYFLTVVLSTLSRWRLYWSVYDPRATFTLDFYSDSRICNKRCCFLNKCGFIVRGTVSFQLLFMQHTRFQRVWRIKKLLILVEHCKKNMPSFLWFT